MAVTVTQAAGAVPSNECDYRTSACLEDEFMGGGVTTTTVGSLGWVFTSGTVAAQASETNHPGIIRRSTGASSGTTAAMYLGPGSTNTAIPGNANFDMTWAFRLNTNDALTAFILGAGLGTQADLIILEKAAADTNFFCRTRTNSNQAKTDTGVAVDTAWHSTRIQRQGSVVNFWLDKILVATNTTFLTSAAISPICLIANSEAAEKTIDIDYFKLRVEVSR